MLLVDERCLQPNLVGADRLVPVASVAASRDLDASSSTQRAATQIAAATRLHQHRPSGICRVVSAGTWRAGRFEDRQAGDRDPLASCRLPSVLALEIKAAQWPSKDPAGNRSAHSRDQSRQPIVGRTTASWRASQARHLKPNRKEVNKVNSRTAAALVSRGDREMYSGRMTRLGSRVRAQASRRWSATMTR